METCPVCGSALTSLLCSACKFDISCSYETYPTLHKPEVFPKSISAYKTACFFYSKDFVTENGILVKYTGNAPRPTIPTGIREIGKDAFRSNKSLTAIIVPEGVTKIGAHAFAECPNLKTVILPESLKEIGAFAFSETPIRHINLPHNLVSLGWSSAFAATKLEKIIIPGSVKIIPLNTFSNCGALEKAVLLPGVSVVEKEAFSHCGNLTTLTVPDTLTEVDANYSEWFAPSFAGCEKLSTVVASDAWKKAHPDLLETVLTAAMSPEKQFQRGKVCAANREFEEALRWYSIAAARGNSKAMCALGGCYEAGKGVAPNIQKAIELYEEACGEGDALAFEMLFAVYVRMSGNANKISEGNCKKLVSIMRKMSVSPTCDGTYFDIAYLVKHHREDCFCVAQNLCRYRDTQSTGLTWIEKCAEDGLIGAQRWLADHYRQGLYLPTDKEKAVYWLEKAADQGDLAAKMELKSMKKGFLGRLFS